MPFPILKMFLFPNCSSAFCPKLRAVLYRFGANGRVGVFSPLEGRGVRMAGLGLLIFEEAVIPCGVIRINCDPARKVSCSCPALASMNSSSGMLPPGMDVLRNSV